MLFLVDYINEKGELSTKRIQADSMDEARFFSGIPDKRIESVRQDYLGVLLKLFEKPRPARKNQAVFLQLLSSSLVAGKTLKSSITKLIDESKWLNVKPEPLEACITLSDYIKLLRFEDSVLLLAETADKTGNSVDALRTASQYLMSQEKLKSEVSGNLKTGITYIVLGSIFFFLVPIFISDSLNQIEESGITLRRNLFTAFLINWGNFLNQFAWLFIIAIPLGAFYREQLWSFLKYQPFFSAFNQKRLLDRGLQFSSTYKMMHQSGFTDAEILKAILRGTKSRTRTIVQRMLNHILASRDIGSAFDKHDWPSVVVDGFSVFSTIDNQEKQKILESVIESCMLENIEASRKISANLSRLGMIMMIMTVLSAAIGFYLPIASAAAGGGAGI